MYPAHCVLIYKADRVVNRTRNTGTYRGTREFTPFHMLVGIFCLLAVIVIGALVFSPDKPPAPPYRLHYNDSLGYYIYRPKRWAELNDYERFALKNDPRLPHFIREHALALRGGEFGGKSDEAQPTSDVDEISRAADAASPMNGLLRQEGRNTWGYRFEPDDLLNTKPLRLVELPQ